jgi:hypothetical protein
VQTNDGPGVLLLEVGDRVSAVFVGIEVGTEVAFGGREGREERGKVAARELEGVLAATVWLRGRVRIKEEVGGRGVP